MRNFELREPQLKRREVVKVRLLKQRTKLALGEFFLEVELVLYSSANKTLIDSIDFDRIDGINNLQNCKNNNLIDYTITFICCEI